jgi:hypothetical protein
MLLALEETALGEARWLVRTHVELGDEKDLVMGGRTITLSTELSSNPPTVAGDGLVGMTFKAD